MARYTIQAPDGHMLTFEGPEGASEQDVFAAAQRLYTPTPAANPEALALAQQPDFKSVDVGWEPTSPGPEVSGPFHAAMIQAGSVPSKLASGASLLWHKAFGTDEDVARIEAERAETERQLSPVSEEYPKASIAGQMLPYLAIPGSAVATLPRAVGTGLGLAGTESGGDPVQTAIGGVMGGAGYGIGAAIGKAVSGAKPPLDRTPWERELIEQGRDLDLKLTPAVETGSKALGIAERSTRSSPFGAGSFQKFDEANQIAANKVAGRAIGENVEQLTPDVLDSAAKRIGGNFEELTINKDIPLDDSFLDALGRIEAIETGKWGRKDVMSRYVDDALDEASKGVISGKRYQELRSSLGAEANQQMTSAKGDRQVGEALFDLQAALDDAASKVMTGEERQAFAQAREQWKHLRTLTDTSVINEQGNVSLLKLGNKLRTKDKAGYARGGITGTGTPTQDLYAAARWAQSFKQPGTSQTAERLSLPLTWMSVPMTGGASIPLMMGAGRALTSSYPWRTGILGLPKSTRDILARTGSIAGIGGSQ